jgi:hypothetical protein
MENYELNIEAPPKRFHNWFPKGHKPFNKGVPMIDWMDGRKIRKVKKYLELGRHLGNKHLPGANRIPIVGIKDGKLYPFDSAVTAARILKSKGVKVCSRNICCVIHCKLQKNNRNGRYYVRRKAGGYQWFFADQPELYSKLIAA